MGMGDLGFRGLGFRDLGLRVEGTAGRRKPQVLAGSF